MLQIEIMHSEMIQYLSQKKQFIKRKIGKVFINLVSLAILIAIIIFTPIGFRRFSEITGYFQKETKLEDHDDYLYESNIGDAEDFDEESIPIGETMVITERSDNISSGPGTDY